MTGSGSAQAWHGRFGSPGRIFEPEADFGEGLLGRGTIQPKARTDYAKQVSVAPRMR